jgi:phosphatidylethanolamine-binding protein (PEBP) family uncharacterized protein
MAAREHDERAAGRNLCVWSFDRCVDKRENYARRRERCAGCSGEHSLGSTRLSESLSHWPGAPASPRRRTATRPDEYYSVLCVDPDVPGRVDHKFRSFLHWAVVNVPGEDLKRGDTLAEYVGACPAEDAGVHRYVFLVYAQKNMKVDVSKQKRLKKNSFDGRSEFNAEQFIASVGGADWQLVSKGDTSRHALTRVRLCERLISCYAPCVICAFGVPV